MNPYEREEVERFFDSLVADMDQVTLEELEALHQKATAKDRAWAVTPGKDWKYNV